MQRLVLALTLLATTQAFSQTTLKFAAINFPGAIATQARGINASGEIVGFYQSSSCFNYTLQVPSCPTKGYKLVNGNFTELNIPNSIRTAMTGVNDNGDIVGFYQKTDLSYHGFLWLHTNVIETIDYPNTTYATVPMGIDNSLTVVGGLWVISATGTFASGGWVWGNGTFSVLDLGGTGCQYCTSVNGISNNGIMVGQAWNDDWLGWLIEGTDLQFFKINNSDTFFTGVNSNTDIVAFSGGKGWFAAKGGTEQQLNYILVHYPNSSATFPFGLNLQQAIVGAYQDGSGYSRLSGDALEPDA